MQPQSLKVFFSYTRADSKFALRLAEDMRSAGIKLWIDQLDIPPTALWDKAVEDALKTCPRLLIILSPASVTSRNVMDEAAFAIDQNKMIIPVLYQNCDIPFRLKRLHYLDFTGDYNTAITKLLEVLDVDIPEDGRDTSSAKHKRILVILSILAALISLVVGMIMTYDRNDWKPNQSGQALPENILEGGWEHLGQGGKRLLYICRSEYDGGVIPGKLLENNCYIPYKGRENPMQNYEALAMSHAHWIPITTDSLPNGAVIGGHEPNNASPLYICRAKKSTTDGGIQGIHPGKLLNGICSIGFAGLEEQHSQYEVLVKDSN